MTTNQQTVTILHPFRIHHRESGQNMGVFFAQDAANALAAMHRDAGYRDVRSVGGVIVWPDEETRAVCGGFESWSVVREESED